MPRGGKREGSGRSKKENNGRSRNWNVIVWPDSAPENWREIIDEMHIEWVESPLHDKDVNDKATGDENAEIKKPHYHLVLLFPGLKSYEQIKEITDSINQGIPERCNTVKGSIQYLIHKNNPEKYQYNWSDIVCHGGADLDSLCAATAMERLQIQKDIISHINQNNIIEFEDIVNYSLNDGLDDWLNVLLNYSTMSINSYIRSRRHKSECRCNINPETGEVIEN